MARSKAELKNIDKSDPANYPEGRIKDNTGNGGGTPVNEFVYGDMHQTFAKLMALYQIKYNGLPDNETNGYQLIDSLIALASKNDFVLPLTASGGKLNLQLKIGSLKAGESFICKAAVDKTDETTVKGSLDNVEKAAAFSGDFKAGEFVRVINNADNVEFIRLVDAVNLETVNKALKFLQAATQTQEDAGTSEAVSTTPITNKAVFSKRVNGPQSSNYLASQTRNGLLSLEDKKILDNIGQSRLRNVGYLAGINVSGLSPGNTYPIGGDITRAEKKQEIDSGDVIEVTFKNGMDNTSYKLDVSIESQGNIRYDNDLMPVVWRPVSTTKAEIYLQKLGNVTQNLKIHIDVIQL